MLIFVLFILFIPLSVLSIFAFYLLPFVFFPPLMVRSVRLNAAY